jgi:hypothetical protein
MKLERVLDQLNSFEKNPFLKIIDTIILNNPKNAKQVDKILSDTSKDLKNVDNQNISNVFKLISDEFAGFVWEEFENTTSQFDILIDILIRDGNCILSREWLATLYDKETKSLNRKIKSFRAEIDSPKPTIDSNRIRDYKIYKACLEVAYKNDLDNNQECKITQDEHSILSTLSKKLELSQEEKKLINYSILPIQKIEIDKIINDLKYLGIIFYSKKNLTAFVPDEIVAILRRIREKQVADKYFRRVLKLVKDAQINQICRIHNIDRKLDRQQKTKEIISHGISFMDVLTKDIFKDNVKLSERKVELNIIVDKGLMISPPLKGSTIEQKVANLVLYFNELEKDEKVAISVNGYEKLLLDLNNQIPSLNNVVRSEFELQDDKVLLSSLLLDYNIKPRDVLEIIDEASLSKFAVNNGIKSRGNTILNILESYKDSENLFLENYEKIGARDLRGLKENGIDFKEAELGLKFEELTKTIFKRLGFDVDEKLRIALSTAKNKIDIVINLGNSDLIILECKSFKESGYNKFSSVSRQIKSYIDTAKVNDYNVVKSLLVAPDFSDDFVNECELEYELNLSLITAASLVKIMEGFKNSKHKQLPYKLLLRDVLIREDRIIKAISK